MRILQVIDALGTGGKERQFIELLKGLKRQTDVETRVVVMSDVIEYEDFARLGIEATLLKRRIRYDPAVFFRLASVVRSFRPDIVHSWNAMCSVYAGPAGALVGAKFVNGAVRDATPERSVPARLMRLAAQPFSDVVVANSRAGIDAYGIAHAKAAVIYNGFDASRLSRVAGEAETRAALAIETPYVVGMVGAFDRHKDYDTFFEMVRQISARRTDVTFVALGGGSRLERYKAAWPADRFPNVRLLGRRTDVESLVNILTIGVLTSNGEGISNAIMEYMALNKPVVATNAGGNPEVVEDGRTGYLVGDKDAAALTQRVIELIDDPEKARAFGARGRDRIETVFSLEQLTRNYMDLYRRLLASG
ncbi:MAG TPA: glycosyltransferase [Rhizomicrobium sp.]|nr:glycosyltransferase [Rhizomicrobium sp.]